MMREAERLMDEFVALISHELRTPLTSIIGYLELTLDDSNLTEEQRGYLDVVDHNADRLLKLVDDLLFVAQVEAGELEVRASELDLAAIARQSVAEAEPRAVAKGITLTYDADAAVPVQADKGRLFKVLDNLVSNAIKYTPDGGGVSIRMTHTGDAATIAVSDTGIGIPQDEQAQMFGRFFRSSNARDSGIEGSGLGLAITRGIVEAHGGTIGFDSVEGVGTTFRLTVPLSLAAAA